MVTGTVRFQKHVLNLAATQTSIAHKYVPIEHDYLMLVYLDITVGMMMSTQIDQQITYLQILMLR